MALTEEWTAAIIVGSNALSALGGSLIGKWTAAKGEQERANVTQLFSRIDQLHAELDALRTRHDEEMDEVRSAHATCREENADLRHRLESLEKKAGGAA